MKSYIDIANTISVTRLTEIERLHEVHDCWVSLQHHPNTDYDFFHTLFRNRKALQRPFIILVSDKGNCTSILVARVEDQVLDFKLGYLRFFKLPVRALTIPIGGFLGTQTNDLVTLLLANTFAALQSGDVKLLHFSYLDTSSIQYQCILKSVPWYRYHIRPSQPHRIMELPDSTELFFSKLSSKNRKHLRQSAKKLVAAFPNGVRIARYTKVEEVERMLRDVDEVSVKTWQHGVGVGFTNDVEMAARLHSDASRGAMRAHLLYVNDTPCAFWLCTAYKGTLHSEFLGYDPAFSAYAPGMYLITQTISALCADKAIEGIATVDFGIGDALYKQQLGTRSWDESTVQVFPPTLRGIVLCLLTKLLGLVEAASRYLIRRSKLTARLKTIWRRTSTPPLKQPGGSND